VVLKNLSYVLGGALFLLVTTRYVALSSNVADLGFFLNNLTNVDNQWPRAFYGHVQPLMFLWGIGFKELPSSFAPLVLVGLQVMALLGSVVVIWRVLGVWPGLAMLLYYPLWVNALFDFHFDHLAVPLLVVFFISCEFRRFGWATLAAATLVLVKEPFALQTVACGAYLGCMAFYQRGSGVSLRLVFFGALIAFWGAGWFYVSTQWLLPYFGDGGPGTLQSEAFSWLGSSLSEMVWTLVSRPDRVLAEILSTPGKLIYLTVIFGLLAFLPLLRPAALLVALPLLMIAMLSRQDNYYGYTNHYTAGVIVPAVVAFRDGLPIARGYFASLAEWIMSKLERYPLPIRKFSTCNKFFRLIVSSEGQIFSMALFAWLLVGHCAFVSSPVSRLFWSDKVWSYSWKAYVPTERELMMKQAMLQYIPTDSNVSVTTQNTVNWYHLADRKVYLLFPLGVNIPHRLLDWSNRDLPGLWKYVRTGLMPPATAHARYADYVVLDLKRPWFVIDKGCDWLYGACRNNDMATKFLRLVGETRQRYYTVFERDGFIILKRK
jgi:uncharacterized membrane protein